MKVSSTVLQTNRCGDARGLVQLQNWLCPAIGYDADGIPEKSAQKIFRAADQLLKAGRLTIDAEEPDR
jgi:hypothetical protein